MPTHQCWSHHARLPDEWWDILQPHLGERVRSSDKGGRQPYSFLQVWLLALRDKVAARRWRARLGISYNTVMGQVDAWQEAGCWDRAWAELLSLMPEAEMAVLFIDGAHAKAPNGGEGTGRSPVDRGKCGVKQVLLSTRRRLPVSCLGAAANTNDCLMLEPCLEAASRPLPEGFLLLIDRGFSFAPQTQATWEAGGGLSTVVWPLPVGAKSPRACSEHALQRLARYAGLREHQFRSPTRRQAAIDTMCVIRLLHELPCAYLKGGY